jgi:hypothetical protein
MFSFLDALLKRRRPPDQLAGSEYATAVIFELFLSHQFPCSMSDGWICAESGALAAQARMPVVHLAKNTVTIQIEIEVVTAHRERIIESYAGVGKTMSQAIGDALDAFCNGSFHAILSGVTSQPCTHCTVEPWVIDGRTRWIFLGPTVTRGTVPTVYPFPRQWFTIMERHIKASRLVSGMHWVRIYHAENEGSAGSTSEVLVDNEVAPALQSHLESLPWPATDKFYSIRVFFMVTDATESTTM